MACSPRAVALPAGRAARRWRATSRERKGPPQPGAAIKPPPDQTPTQRRPPSGYGPARVGARRRPLPAEAWPPHATLRDASVAEDKALEALRQRAFLVDLGENPTVVPWHHERLDVDARRFAVGQLVAAASPESGTPARRAAVLRSAGERLRLVHGPNPTSATERLEHLVGRLASAAGRPRPEPWSLGAGSAWPAVGAVYAADDPRSPPHDVLRAPILGVDDAQVLAEWRFEAELLQRRVAGRPVQVLCSPVPGGLVGPCTTGADPWIADWWSARAVPIRQGVLLFNGARVRLGWRDAIGTFNPAFVVARASEGGGFFPASRNEAAGATARRLTERGDVAVLVPEARALREVQAGYDGAPEPERGAGGGLRLAVWADGDASVCDGASALIVCGLRRRGQPIGFEWLWRAIARLGRPGRHREALVLHAIEARQQQRRVIRDVELADALMARDQHPPVRSGVVQVLEAFGDELSPAIIRGLREGGAADASWVEVLAPLLTGAALFRAALPEPTRDAVTWQRALQSTRAFHDAADDARVRGLLEALCAPRAP